MHCLLQCKMVQPPQKVVWQFFKRLNTELYDLATQLLGAYSKESGVQTLIYLCSQLHDSQQLKGGKRKWMKKVQHMHTIKYYLPIKGNEILIYATIWMNLEDITQSEVNQTQKEKCYMIPLMLCTQNRQIHRDRKQIKNFGPDWGWVEGESSSISFLIVLEFSLQSSHLLNQYSAF